MAVANWVAALAMVLTQIKTGQYTLPCLIVYFFASSLEPESQIRRERHLIAIG
jgi:hypothetical protein